MFLIVSLFAASTASTPALGPQYFQSSTAITKQPEITFVNSGAVKYISQVISLNPETWRGSFSIHKYIRTYIYKNSSFYTKIIFSHILVFSFLSAGFLWPVVIAVVMVFLVLFVVVHLICKKKTTDSCELCFTSLAPLW